MSVLQGVIFRDRGASGEASGRENRRKVARMAREHARLLTSIWSDRDFLKLSRAGQRFYMLAFSQPGMTYAGVVPYTVERWAGLAADDSPRRLRASIAEVRRARFVIIDEHSQELFIRSYLRHDRILRQPNVTIAACRAYLQIVSPLIRAAWLVELHRLADDPTHVAESRGRPVMSGLAAATLADRYAERLPEGFPEGFPEGLYEDIPKQFWERFTEPIPDDFPEDFGDGSARVRAAPSPSPRTKAPTLTHPHPQVPESRTESDSYPLPPFCPIHRDQREPCPACQSDQRHRPANGGRAAERARGGPP